MHSECSKVSYYQPKNQHFLIINQQPKFCAILFFKINPDAHFGTKINTFTFYKGGRGGGGGGGGGNSPQKPKKCKKMEVLRFLQQILHTGRQDISCNDVNSDSCLGGADCFY